MSNTNFRSIMEFIILMFMLPLVWGGQLSPTDTITWGGDNSRAGYQTTHGMDPSVVGSSIFGQIFKTALPGNYINAAEQVFSQPLVYTLNDGIQYVFLATTQNNVYKINAKTGVIVASRNLHVPFLTSDLDGCVDINPTVGVTATGVIDPSTDTWYLTSKTYAPGITQGRQNGRYYFHAIDVNTLVEQANFPIDLENTPSRNTNGAREFQAGEAHQRPALLLTGQYVYAGFASHCVQYNFTGWIMGWDKTTGQNVEAFAMEGGPEPNSIKGAGVWMSGGGLASDGQGSMYFGSGNGYASQLHGISVPGHSPPSALEEAAIHAKLNDNGTITIVDFFMPWEKEQLDGADKDLGTTPLELLPTDVFTCPNVKRMGVITGKSGKTYFLNIDNLGGYQMGPNHLDAVPQVTQNENSVYAGAGVYPGEGGYIYISVIQYPTHVFKFSCDSNGNPAFTHVADSPDNNAYILGVGHGTVTSLNGQAGTGLVWVTDVEGYNLRIYNAVPTNGLLNLVNQFNIPGVTKFTRPVFGDARAYIGTTTGFFYGFGSPVNLPLNCSSPYQFGTVTTGNQSAPVTVSCLAATTVQITSAVLSGNKNFLLSNIPKLPVTLNAGDTFNFTAVFAPNSPGPLSSDVLLNTTATGFSPNTPITLKGTGESLKPVLGVTPNTLSFNGVITGQIAGGVNSSAILLNSGDGVLNITSIDYSVTAEGGVTVKPNITSLGIQVGPFTFINMPTSIPGKSQVTIGVNFNPTVSGNFAVYMTIHSNGGDKIFDVVATSGTYPKALVEFQAADGSGNWIPYSNTSSFSFGTVLEQQTRTLKMRVSNVGDKNAGQLSITVSKPPFGVPGIINAVNGVDLAEGTSLAANTSATADLYCSVPKSQVNTDSYNGTAQWTLNTGDPTLGKLFIQFVCTAASEQVGPLAANGSALYRYDFCAVENNPGRQLATRLYQDNANTNDLCITACAKAGYKYCGTQYQVECWAGNSVPIASSLERDCTYACAGNNNETCGGNGFFQNGTFISLFVNPALAEGAPNPVGGGGGGNTPTSFKNPATIGNYSSLGCYTEATTGKALTGAHFDNDPAMTLEWCAGQMSGFNYWGVEYGQECYGGNVLGAGAVPTADSDCSFPCPGNSSESCGAGNRLQLYSNGQNGTSGSGSGNGGTTTPASGNPATIGAFSSLGCYSEPANGKALIDNRQDDDGAMTLEWCATQMAQYNYFGVEYGQECYGGNVLQTGAASAPAGDCSFPCPGNSSETCGAGNRLQLYGKGKGSSTSTSTISTGTATSATLTVTTTSGVLPKSTGTTIPMVAGAYSFVGCYSESTGAGRALTGASNMTSKSVDNCAAFCTANGATKFFGVEYYGQCFCGDSLDPTSQPTTGCTYPCDLNSTQICGGNAVLDLYELTKLLPTTTTSTPTPTPTAPSTVQKINGWSFTGCYTEGTNGRALSGLQNPIPGANNSIEACGAACKGFNYFGVEYGAECYCGNTLGAGAVVAPGGTDVTQNGCNMLCAANQFEYCGGPNRLDLYSSSPVSTSSSATVTSTTVSATSSATSVTSTTSATPTPTGPVTVQTLAGWTYLACYTEGTNDRALNGLLNPVPANNSVEACGSACAGYTYFGVEYGAECYCGNSFSAGAVVAAGGSDPNANGCSIVCAGNSNEYCGGGNRLNVYKSAPLTTSTLTSTTISSTSTTSSTTTSTTSATPTPTGPITVQTLSGWAYLACYTEGTNDRALNGLENPIPGANNSVEACGAACAGYTYFGVEYGAECYCGNTFTAGAVIAAGGSDPNANGCSIVCAANPNEYCGGGNRLNVYKSAPKVTSTSTTVSKTSSTSTSTTSTTTSTSIATTSTTVSTSSSVITSSTSAAPTPTGPLTVQTVPGFSYLGCYTEATNSRALSDLQNPIPAANVSVEACAKACAGYKYFGVEYSSECYCGNTLNAGSVVAPGGTDVTQNGCSLTCAANATEYCGGGNRLNLYTLKTTTTTTSKTTSTTSTPVSTSSSKSTSSTPSSAPSSKSTTSTPSATSSTSVASTKTSTSVSSTSTLTSKTATSTSVTSTTSSSKPSTTVSSTPTSSSTTVKTSTSVSTTSAPTTSKTSTSTSTSTTSSSSKATSTSITPTSTQTSTQTLTVATSTSISATTTSAPLTTSTTSANSGPPTPTVAAVKNWSYQGCYTEGTNARALASNAVVASNMSAEYCASIAAGNYLYFGVEFGSECYMGNAFSAGAVVSTVNSDCATTCSGNSTEICGGASRLTVYKANAAIAPVMPSVVAGNKEFKYYNCVNELSNARALGNLLQASDDMTIEKCLGLATGTKYAGVEYGRECWADSTLNSAATNATTAQGASVPACGMTCGGSKGEYCGDQNRLTVYINNGTATK